MDKATTLRILGPDDYDAFYALRHDALEQSPHSYGNDIDTWKAARKEQVLALLEDSVAPTDGCIMGAFVEDTLAGMLGVRREGKFNVRHKATLWGFFVQPRFRQKGVGTALVREALARAGGYAGLHHVRLIVTVDDAPAQRVFESQGFEPYGLEKDGIFSGDRLRDQRYMMKIL